MNIENPKIVDEKIFEIYINENKMFKKRRKNDFRKI